MLTSVKGSPNGKVEIFTEGNCYMRIVIYIGSAINQNKKFSSKKLGILASNELCAVQEYSTILLSRA